MTLLHMSGFEGSPKPGETIEPGVTYASNGRTGMCLAAPTGVRMTLNIGPGGDEIVLGVAINPPAILLPTDEVRILLSDHVGYRLGVFLEVGGGLYARLYDVEGESDHVETSTDSIWGEGEWIYLEIHAKLDLTSSGFCKVYVDGVEVLSYTGITQINGEATPSTLISADLFGSGTIGDTLCRMDDLYLLNSVDATATQGRAYNAPLGGVRVSPLSILGSEPTNEWVGSDGDSVDNHLLIDDVPPSSVEYVESTTAGERDLYSFSNVGVTGEVFAIDITAFTSSPDSSPNTIKMGVVSELNNELFSSGDSLSNVYESFNSGPLGLSPDDTPWTKTLIGNAKYGMETG